MGNDVKFRAEPLPATRDEMIERRKIKSTKTLNDWVDDIHITLYGDNEPYTTYLDAVYDEMAVEGSLAIDNAKAAEIIRDYARNDSHPRPYIAKQKLASIVKALNVVLRRYCISRKERAIMIGDEAVPNDN